MKYPFQRILLTGGSGFLGQHLIATAPTNAQLLSLWQTKPLRQTNIDQLQIDLTDETAFAHLMATWQPDLVIHAAALSDVHDCERNPALSHRVNVYVTEHIAEQCHHQGIQLVFTSTDLVFDGTSAPYHPLDAVHPISTYGRHKAEAEKTLQQRYPNATIVRLPVMYGLPQEDRNNLLTALVKKWIAGEQTPLFTDEYRSIAHAQDIAAGLYLVAQHAGEIFHLGGPAPVSRYAFGEAVQRLLGLPSDLIQATQQQDVTLTAPRPANVSMDSTAAYELGFEPADISAGLQQLAPALQQWYQDWCNNG